MGNGTELDVYLSKGFSIGITGSICDDKRLQDLQEIVCRIPSSRLMIETDSPYLTPKTIVPRPRQNEPQYLCHIVRAIAELSQQDSHEVAKQTALNAKHFFSI